MRVLIIILLFSSCSSKSWREASRESVHIAPKASELKEAIFQIYYARAFSWRGAFGVHPWIAWKSLEDKSYTVAQVTSWNRRRSKSTVSVVEDLPDRMWFDHRPHLLLEIRGEQAQEIIAQLPKLISEYPFQDSYTLWPGPNSNTFVSYIIRNIDEIKIELPPHAIGKDYFGASQFFSKTASQMGYQFSLFGLLGLSVGVGEGIEFNILGLNFGIDFYTPALKLPFIGRLGFDDKKM
ncbi:DUF3750 domain-containing protein [bacterium]|nr:DUF3750 domain-containing protein [bacterium]